MYIVSRTSCVCTKYQGSASKGERNPTLSVDDIDAQGKGIRLLLGTGCDPMSRTHPNNGSTHGVVVVPIHDTGLRYGQP